MYDRGREPDRAGAAGAGAGPGQPRASPPTGSPTSSASPSGPPGATSASCARPASRSSPCAGRTAATASAAALRLPPLMFSATEALGLVMAVLDGHHDAERSHRPGRQRARQDRAGAARRRWPPRPRPSGGPRRPAPDRAAARPDPGDHHARWCRRARDRRRVRLGYRSEAGSEWDIEVDPWAVVVRHGRWYLLCRSHRRGRACGPTGSTGCAAVEVLDDTFTPPADLDPVAMLEEHLAVGWEYDVEVVIDAPARHRGAGASPARSAASSRSTTAPPG